MAEVSDVVALVVLLEVEPVSVVELSVLEDVAVLVVEVPV